MFFLGGGGEGGEMFVRGGDEYDFWTNKNIDFRHVAAVYDLLRLLLTSNLVDAVHKYLGTWYLPKQRGKDRT